MGIVLGYFYAPLYLYEYRAPRRKGRSRQLYIFAYLLIRLPRMKISLFIDSKAALYVLWSSVRLRIDSTCNTSNIPSRVTYRLKFGCLSVAKLLYNVILRSVRMRIDSLIDLTCNTSNIPSRVTQAKIWLSVSSEATL